MSENKSNNNKNITNSKDLDSDNVDLGAGLKGLTSEMEKIANNPEAFSDIIGTAADVIDKIMTSDKNGSIAQMLNNTIGDNGKSSDDLREVLNQMAMTLENIVKKLNNVSARVKTNEKMLEEIKLLIIESNN